jgi:hypothetical protein
MLRYILCAYDELRLLAQHANLNFINFFEIHMISYDNTASNTGEVNGLGKLFDSVRYDHLLCIVER